MNWDWKALGGYLNVGIESYLQMAMAHFDSCGLDKSYWKYYTGNMGLSWSQLLCFSTHLDMQFYAVLLVLVTTAKVKRVHLLVSALLIPCSLSAERVRSFATHTFWKRPKTNVEKGPTLQSISWPRYLHICTFLIILYYATGQAIIV